MEADCEDYGQAVIYNGGIDNNIHAMALDKHHEIELGQVFPVCGNTWKMLKNTRFNEYFEFIGDFSQHNGLFDGCGKLLPFDKSEDDNSAKACC